jgi:tRNA(adenine34) deaminase
MTPPSGSADPVAGVHGAPSGDAAPTRREADAALMTLALIEAERALVTGDVPIGAVVAAADGAVIGRGRNAREASGDPTAHAEIVALREAARAAGSWNLASCTLVVTVEPCTMCAGAAGLARVSAVVFGCWEPKTGAAGSLWDVLRDRRLPHRAEVRSGVLADQCAALVERFFAERR